MLYGSGSATITILKLCVEYRYWICDFSISQVDIFATPGKSKNLMSNSVFRSDAKCLKTFVRHFFVVEILELLRSLAVHRVAIRLNLLLFICSTYHVRTLCVNVYCGTIFFLLLFLLWWSNVDCSKINCCITQLTAMVVVEVAATTTQAHSNRAKQRKWQQFYTIFE